MLKKDTFDFLKALKENNTKEWFTANKAWYERARTDFEKFVNELIQAVGASDPDVAHLEAKKCIFRIYRDVRFSADKSPYKTNFGAVLRPRNAQRISGYYFHFSPEEMFLAVGHYMLMPDQLKKIRKGIYSDYEGLREILDNKQFKNEIGDLCRDQDALQRVPNGFDKEHPSAEYLKLKRFYVMKPLTEAQMLSADIVPYIGGIYKIMRPLGDFLMIYYWKTNHKKNKPPFCGGLLEI